MNPERGLYGVMAEFGDEHRWLAAIRRARAEGYRKLDAYSPFPVEGAAEALGYGRTWVPQLVLAGALAGGIGGFALQAYLTAVAYPHNVGGRPLVSWPMYVPITFELTILLGSIAGLIGMLVLNGLPRPHHPVFNVERFARASQDRFFLVVEADDPGFDHDRTRAFLQELGAYEVSDVPE